MKEEDFIFFNLISILYWSIVVLVLGVQQSDSVIHLHSISILKEKDFIIPYHCFLAFIFLKLDSNCRE